MTKKWRPEGLAEHLGKLFEGYAEGTGGNNAENSGYYLGLEDGADAMLDALKETAPMMRKGGGWFIIIPDDGSL